MDVLCTEAKWNCARRRGLADVASQSLTSIAVRDLFITRACPSVRCIDIKRLEIIVRFASFTPEIGFSPDNKCEGR